MKGLPRLHALPSGFTVFRAPRPSVWNVGRRWESTSPILSRKWSTPLAEDIAKAIATTGPITLAQYMRQCLTSPDGGYYTRQYETGRDQFGVKGDFITAPEISQIFGELVGLWVVAEWMAQGRRPSGVQLIELGPGRGTLMDDILRTIQSFPPLANAIEEIYLIEASPMLREKQHGLLCGLNAFENTETGHTSLSKHKRPVRLHWVSDILSLPQSSTSKSPFFIAHEFFDALPIHAFTSVSTQSPLTTTTTTTTIPKAQNQWRELLVDIAPPPPTLTISTSSTSHNSNSPDFALTLSSSPTPYSQLLPSLLPPRYSQLLSLPPGTTIEISPESLSTAGTIAKHIGASSSGGALFMDYGPEQLSRSNQPSSHVPVNSLRGIHAHKLISPFWGAGTVDLSASVDFGALAAAALEADQNVEVHGHVRQAGFLRNLGGQERANMLIEQAKAANDEEGEKRIRMGWERLIDEGVRGMGKLYQVMAVVPFGRSQQGGVVGFGGDVV